ncbi:hypothetical protein BLOT_011857 [Blomia tropicalis]|nr:hypothetical protein BLOT_011857 [Blomia tropicalis]
MMRKQLAARTGSTYCLIFPTKIPRNLHFSTRFAFNQRNQSTFYSIVQPIHLLDQILTLAVYHHFPLSIDDYITSILNCLISIIYIKCCSFQQLIDIDVDSKEYYVAQLIPTTKELTNNNKVFSFVCDDDVDENNLRNKTPLKRNLYVSNCDIIIIICIFNLVIFESII